MCKFIVGPEHDSSTQQILCRALRAQERSCRASNGRGFQSSHYLQGHMCHD
jgi:hypothetical protein